VGGKRRLVTPTILQTDFYKIGHVSQYADGVTQIWDNVTPRSSRIEGVTSAVHLGMRYLIQKHLISGFNETFFGRSRGDVISEYKAVISATLGVPEPKVDHIERLHDIGYLPIKIYSIPEGRSTPLRVPNCVLTNTLPEAFWLPNYLETLISATLWKPSISATIAQQYRRICAKWAIEARETDLSYIDYQCHDFSMRGMSGVEDAALSGLGHLTCFKGTDSIPAILLAHEYYGADYSIAGSVPATEHSVMCAGGKENEYETFRRLIEDVYPNGIVSIVSDTWDLWKVLTDYIPRLKDSILKRNGPLVIRPDSGSPELITCGDPTASGAARFGVLRLLAETLGVTRRVEMLPIINNGREIYGDSITMERCNTILGRMVRELGLSPQNMVFGVGSFTYQRQTRDSLGFAIKATAVRHNGTVVPIFKDPITDDGSKRSAYGIPCVYEKANGDYTMLDDRPEEELDNCAFDKVFEDGRHLVKPSFNEIRERVTKGAEVCRLQLI
jgi:nicotinamide phosphoribosyltransferase